MNKYDPDSVSPPWHTLQEIMDEQNLNWGEMADKCDLHSLEMYRLLKGELRICRAYGEHLEKGGFGTADFWEARTRRYEEWLEGKNDISI